MGTQSPPAEATLEGGEGRPHVLVVPFPAQGHMLALLDLVALLATRGDDLSVTVAITAGNTALLEPLLAACPSVGVVTLPFPSSPFLPPAGCAAENTRELPYHLFRMFLPALAALRAPLLSWCQAQAQARRVTAVVSDLFAGWARPLADEIGARHVTFSPCSALYVAMSLPLWRRMPRADADVAFPDVPGPGGAPVSFSWRQLPTIYRHHQDGDEASEAIRQILLWSLESECVVVNSFASLEATYLEHPPRVLAVGPLRQPRREAVCGGGGGVRLAGRVPGRVRGLRQLRDAARAVAGAGGARRRRPGAELGSRHHSCGRPAAPPPRCRRGSRRQRRRWRGAWSSAGGRRRWRSSATAPWGGS
ncbi:unnamed protein product [Urochloa humidicola]